MEDVVLHVQIKCQSLIIFLHPSILKAIVFNQFDKCDFSLFNNDYLYMQFPHLEWFISASWKNYRTKIISGMINFCYWLSCLSRPYKMWYCGNLDKSVCRIPSCKEINTHIACILYIYMFTNLFNTSFIIMKDLILTVLSPL